MSKLLPTIVAAVVVLLLGWNFQSDAQEEREDGSLKACTDKVKDALLAGTAEELFRSLAPWLQGRAELFEADFHEELDTGFGNIEDRENAEKSILKEFKQRDPANILELETIEDVRKLDAAQLVAVSLNFYSLRDEKYSPGRKYAKWFEVDREVTQKDVGDGRLKQIGRVQYANAIHHDEIEVTTTCQEGVWYVEGLVATIGDLKIDSNNPILMKDRLGKRGGDNSTRDSRRAEAEQLLGAARDRSRVQYAKTGTPPTTLSTFTKVAELTGEYFSIRDTITNQASPERGLLVATPNDESDGWGTIEFNYQNGKSAFTWYDTEDALNKAVEAFKSAK